MEGGTGSYSLTCSSRTRDLGSKATPSSSSPRAYQPHFTSLPLMTSDY